MPANSLYLDAPAKINWHLQIVGRRSDGFHELLSSFACIGLCDRVVAEPMTTAAKSCIQLLTASTQGDHFPVDPSNLIMRAEKLWRESGGIAPAIAWSVEKNIPSRAGLGGGSSNAAAALMLLQELAAHPLPHSAIGHIAILLGSDVPFFLQENSPALMAGRGEVFVSDISLPTKWVVLAIPEFSIETAAVFSELNAPDFVNAQVVEAKVSNTPGPNHLFEAAVSIEPRLGEFAARISQHATFCMSGSGSTMFAAFSDKDDADDCAVAISSLCQTTLVTPIVAGPVLNNPQAI
ncbi:MAG: hypothetical protein QGF46_01465 [Planctomycetota bacterium]|jgi:4-diphosphocytidyl-2-C-methyl-D-erythritol kinase|nr:hypothetical protein [Planctomycetota bacterium]